MSGNLDLKAWFGLTSSVKKPIFTVICPVNNEEVTVPLFFQRVEAVFRGLSDRYRCQLLFVDNCSKDSTQKIIVELSKQHPWVSLLAMSRNFGYQCSLEAGLRTATGDVFAFVDVDCEDPPEMFVDFLKHYEDGFDIVYGERVDREEAYLLKLARKLFYRGTRAVADDFFVLDMAEFSLFSSEVREAILKDNNSFPFIRASIGRVGYRLRNIPYKRHPRIAGKTHYNFLRMAIFAVAGILSSSTMLLRAPAYLFPFWFLGLVATFTAYQWTDQGLWLHVMILLGFLYCGFTLMGIALYSARTYKNVLNRPNYHIDRKATRLQLLET